MGKIGICVVGSGRAGMIHAVNFATAVPGAYLAAIVDPVEHVAREASAQLGIGRYYLDYRQALEDKDVDAVVIVTPTKFHVDIAVDAAKAGKHILCEKPMAQTVRDCQKMNKAVAESGVVLQLGFMRRFDAGFVQAKEIVDSGAIGDVVMVRSNTRGPSIPKPWMYDISESLGPLAEVNSHDIDTLRWFTGGEFSTIYAVGGNYRSPDARLNYPDFYDNVIVAATFDNGMQGMIDGAQGVGYAYDSRVEILGTKGCVFVGRLSDSAVVTCTADTKHGNYPLVHSWTKLFREAYLSEDIAFVDSIVNKAPPRAMGKDGEMAVRVVEAGNKSILEKRIVHLD